MKVEVLSYTNTPETVCAAAMRSTRTKEAAEVVYNILTTDDVTRLLRKARKLKHFGVFEHAVITVSVSGVSRALTHQLVRHRLASYLQQSQRAVEIDTIEDWYVFPETIRTSPYFERYDQLMERVAFLYNQLIADGVPKEDARFVLPNACKTNIVITMNARQWLHFFWLRAREECKAQWEIKEMAQEILSKLRVIAPVIFEEVIEC